MPPAAASRVMPGRGDAGGQTNARGEDLVNKKQRVRERKEEMEREKDRKEEMEREKERKGDGYGEER